jgi:hypothetical protein
MTADDAIEKPEKPPDDAPLGEKWEWMIASADWKALQNLRERRENRNENEDMGPDSL